MSHLGPISHSSPPWSPALSTMSPPPPPSRLCPTDPPPFNSPPRPSPRSISWTWPISSSMIPSCHASLWGRQPPSSTVYFTDRPSNLLLLNWMADDACLTAPESLSNGPTLDISPPLTWEAGSTWKWGGGGSWRRRPPPLDIGWNLVFYLTLSAPPPFSHSWYNRPCPANLPTNRRGFRPPFCCSSLDPATLSATMVSHGPVLRTTPSPPLPYTMQLLY